MAAIEYNYIQKFLIFAKLTQPLHVGSAGGKSEEVLIHPVTRKPYLQASGIAGPFRAYFAGGRTAEEVGDVFGISGEDLPKEKNMNGELVRADDVESRIQFTDGVFVNEPKLELRPHVKIDSVTGTVASRDNGGQKFNTEYIGSGAEVKYAIYLYGKKEDAVADRKLIEDILSAVQAEAVQMGGMKSTGCGYMTITEAYVYSFDMEDEDSRNKWIEEDQLDKSEYDILKISKLIDKNPVAYTVVISGKTEGSMLIRAIAVSEVGEDAPDSVNIRNAGKQYIVPGSSLKGAVRNRMESILSYIGKDLPVWYKEKMIIDAFGGREIELKEDSKKRKNAKDDKYTGRVGNLRFYDTVVGTIEDNDMAPLQHRIRIDKLTGGVMHTGKFSEKNMAGDFEMKIAVGDMNSPDATFALLVMALRDLMIGIYNLGSGYSVGKGFLTIDKVEITDKNNKKAILTSSSVSDEERLISTCFDALSKAVSLGKEES